MKLSVSPAKLTGTAVVPGSKSHTIRAIAIATLAQGTSVIRNPLVSDDTLSCLHAAAALGAWIRRGDDSEWQISGTGGNLLEPAKILNMGNSGTGIKIFAAMTSLTGGLFTFDGDESLRTRPMEPLLEALGDLGVRTASVGGKCPFRLQGPMVGGETLVEGESSQYLTALLIAAPLAPKNSMFLVQKLNEIPYVDITLDWLRRRNISFSKDEKYTRFAVKGGQKYEAFTENIPGDFSSACFPAVAAAVTGGEITIDNLNFDDAQGDKAIFDYLKQMGAHVSVNGTSVTVKGGKLKAVKRLDLNATPDALPIMAVAAACAEGRSELRNVAQCRIKETDRIACMAAELRKMGIKVEEFVDGMAITGGPLTPCDSLESYKDHRIAMALAVASLAMKKTDAVSTINDAECIAVTYPSFIRDFTALGANFHEL